MNLIVLLSLFLTLVSTLANADEIYAPSLSNPVKYKDRSQELQSLVSADQADRANGMLPGTELRDRKRRQRVGEVFGEGCFATAKDFDSPHGSLPIEVFSGTWTQESELLLAKATVIAALQRI